MRKTKPPLCKGRWAAVRLLGGVVTKRPEAAKTPPRPSEMGLGVKGRGKERI